MDNHDELTSEQKAQSVAPPSNIDNLQTILGIQVKVHVVLGSTTMPVARLMNLARGAVISLDQRVGDPVSIVVNGKVIARGEMVVVDEDNSRFGVALTEVITSLDASGVS